MQLNEVLPKVSLLCTVIGIISWMTNSDLAYVTSWLVEYYYRCVRVYTITHAGLFIAPDYETIRIHVFEMLLFLR